MLRRKKNIDQNPAKDKLAGFIVRKILMVQQRWASFMQQKTDRLSTKSKKYILIAFFLLAGFYCIYLVAESLTGHVLKRSFVIAPIQSPKHITETGEEKIKPPMISEMEYQKIERFKNYMDSCGEKIRDSILHARPGLMDSVLQLEKIYRLQQSSKK